MAGAGVEAEEEGGAGFSLRTRSGGGRMLCSIHWRKDAVDLACQSLRVTSDSQAPGVDASPNECFTTTDCRLIFASPSCGDARGDVEGHSQPFR